MFGKKNIITLLLIISSTFSYIYAEDAEKHPIRARIDISGVFSNPKIALTPDLKGSQNCHLYHPVWINKGMKKYTLTAHTETLPYDKWVMCEFSFTPDNDGELRLDLLSNFSSPPGAAPGVINAHWVYYSALKVTGGIIHNGSFTKREPDTNKVLYWSGSQKNLVKSPYSSKFLKNVVKVWHFCKLTQKIKVKAGQKVTISFRVKACKFVPADKINQE